MKPVQFDLKLSKYFDISINFNSRQIALLRATGYNGSGSLITDGHDFFFNVFIPKSDNITALKPFFQLADIEERGRYYFYIVINHGLELLNHVFFLSYNI